MPLSRSPESMQHISSGVEGVVKNYQLELKFGFISEKDANGRDAMQRDAFFHISAVLDQYRSRRIRVGDRVVYDLYLAPKGYRAESVHILDQESVTEPLETEVYDDLLCENDWFRGSALPINHQPSASGDNKAKGHKQNNEGSTGKQRKKGRRGRGGHRGHGQNNESTEPRSNHSTSTPCSGRKENGSTCPNATPTTQTQLSWSEKQRERGNIFYKSATEDFGSTVRISRLENAITCYKSAFSCSNNKEDEASALKNIGMASWKLATIALEKETEETGKNILKSFKEALKFFCMAYVLRSYKNASWGEKLEESWENCLDESYDWLATLNTSGRIAGFSELIGYLPDCGLKANGYIQYATLLFHEGLTSWQDGEYKDCYRYMKECYFPIQEADRLSEGDSYIKGEVEVLLEDVYLHTCVAESSMARATADNLLKEHFKNDETVNTDTIWTVIDFYKQAAVLCRDKDLEQEAIAYSRLGRVYGKVLNLSSRGKDYYKKAIQLALSMTPRTFHGVDWFKESTAFVENFQKQLNKEEEEDKDKEAALKEMKEDVDKLSKMAAEMCNVDFIKEIYKTWPPRAPGAKLDEKLATKKLLLKAISHYHPDKVDKEVHGNNWFYFSEEITKHLNIKYANHKGVE
nr:uncharacterized protein LOC129257136 [Lytechinus pictus]